jgi:hypothetical protein
MPIHFVCDMKKMAPSSNISIKDRVRPRGFGLIIEQFQIIGQVPICNEVEVHDLVLRSRSNMLDEKGSLGYNILDASQTVKQC